MNALQGSIAERTEAAFSAGCDIILHCNGKLEEMRAVASASPALAGEAEQRTRRAVAMRHAPRLFDRAAGRKELDGLLAQVKGMSA